MATTYDEVTFNYSCPTKDCHTVGQIIGGGWVTCPKCGRRFSVVPFMTVLL